MQSIGVLKSFPIQWHSYHLNPLNWIPQGYVGILMVTDKQFSQMELFHCCQVKEKDVPTQQLELF